eukprot:7859048-Pyramimonas_sp.AAC.1
MALRASQIEPGSEARVGRNGRRTTHRHRRRNTSLVPGASPNGTVATPLALEPDPMCKRT